MPPLISRRLFARLTASAAGTAALFSPRSAAYAATPASLPELLPGPTSSPASFPAGFLWGSATASYQVEGAIGEDGRGPSVWDTFSHTRGKTHNGDTGDIADDWYHHAKDDIAIMQQLGLKACRFSISWSRVFPQGSAQANPKGLDFYDRLLDELLKHGIQPFCTLYHWDLPQALEARGGWQNRDTAEAFAAYAGYTAGKLSDRVSAFMTMNEIRTFTEMGYGTGEHAPGLTLPQGLLAQVKHHAVLGHGLAVAAIRASTKAGTKVGIADNVEACTPAIDNADYITAARRAMREENASYLTVMMEGQYTDLYLKRLGAAAPRFTPAELKAINAPLDFVGINIYTATYIRPSTGPAGYEKIANPSSFPHFASPWLTMGPEALYWAPKLVASVWKVREMYVTENGADSNDVPTRSGEILDTDRIMYLRNYLTHLQRAVAEGVPVRGYFCWSLLDNYEWADGYDKRFGITYVDFKTQKRTLKLSGEFYKEVIARNAVV